MYVVTFSLPCVHWQHKEYHIFLLVIAKVLIYAYTYDVCGSLATDIISY
jgi:hypothetical protein